jgi:hypothetical protein
MYENRLIRSTRNILKIFEIPTLASIYGCFSREYVNGIPFASAGSLNSES